MVVGKADSLGSSPIILCQLPVACRVQVFGFHLVEDGVPDEWVGSLSPVSAVYQAAQIALTRVKLSDAFLIGHLGARLDQLRSEEHVLLAHLGVLQLVLRHGERARFVLADGRWFFLIKS